MSKDVIITETIYPYLRYINDKQNDKNINIKINGKKYTCGKDIKLNPDGSTTLTISLGREFYMKPGDSIEVAFDTALNLSLPIDVVESNAGKDYYINNNTITSSISYNWLGNGVTYRISLPECAISTDGRGM